MKAKKSLGQHFLSDKEICQRIVEEIPESLAEQYIEVGPGRGALTDFLVNKKFASLILVETDRDLIPMLIKKYPTAKIIHANFLKLDFHVILAEKPTLIIGNFPYNISSQIVFKALENYSLIPGLIGMFQKEMALRICASPGNKNYGIISVLAQSLYECNLLFDVDRYLFVPPPNVDSSVIKMVRKENPLPKVFDPLFKQIVKTTFGQRRKMLRNTLKPLIEKEHLRDEFFLQRPEQLSINDFVYITEYINKHKK